MYETIDLLQQTTDYYYIDYIPYNTDDPNFLELEEYFEKHYLSSFSEKITKIILKKRLFQVLCKHKKLI